MYKLPIVLGLLIVCYGAHAQSSVTLFGTLDDGLNYTSNAGGHSAWQMSSVDLAISRWGLKGDEDLGDGTHAIFDLESGITIENGRIYYGSHMFGYQSYVGLKSDHFGTLTFGRQGDSIADVIGPMTANGNWAGFLFSHPLDNDNTDSTFHVNNAVKFTSASIVGLSVTSMYGLSNLAGEFASNRLFGVGVNYANGPWTFGGVYENVLNPGTTSTGAIASDDANFTAGSHKIYGVGGSYAFDRATLALVYSRVNVGNPTNSIYVGDLGSGIEGMRFDNMELNLKFQLNPELMIGGMYTYTRGELDGGGYEKSLHWNQFGLMAQYSLSKRTAIYSQVVYQKVNSGNTGTALDGALIPGAADVSSTSQQVVARVGIPHSF